MDQNIGAMKILPISILPAVLLLAGCGNPSQEAAFDPNPSTLEGTWKQVLNLPDGDTVWQKLDQAHMVYLKHLTPTHFTWISVDTREDKMIGSGGGSYTYDGQTYIEDIAFFHPPGSNELGQAIPFSVQFKDGQWYHTGYAKVMDFDPDLGEFVITDSSKIEEIWEPVTDAPGGGAEILGAWELVSYREIGDSVYSEFPEFIKYWKLVTPTHFLWVYYNSDADEVVAEGGGTYTLTGNSYTEFFEYIHPPGSPLVGKSMQFDYSKKDGKWVHKGIKEFVQKDSQTGEDMTTNITVDEVWKAFTPVDNI